MATHKFAVGQAVRFSPDRGQEHEKGELFKIVRLLSPKQGTCSNTALKARPTVTSASSEKINSQSVKIDMPTKVLKLTRAPSDASVEQAPQSVVPLLRGTGDTDYLCG